jgi:hypothetical protein
MKTKAFDQLDYDNYNKILDKVGYGNSYKAAQEYTDQQTKELREEIERLKESKWISVEERLPEENESILLYGKMYGWKQSGIFHNGKFYKDHDFKIKIKPTHWQPLPNNPI